MINNLNKFIKDYQVLFNIKLDKVGINKILEDVAYKFGESGANEGDAFCVEDKKYIKNGFGFLDVQIILFNFRVISKKYKYIIDEDTGEQVVDEVVDEVVEYLGFN